MSELAKQIIEEVLNMTRNPPKDQEGLNETGGDAERSIDVLLNTRAPDLALAQMRVALERSERKLRAYVGVCKGDKELTETVLPMAQQALASSPADGLVEKGK